jgi:hypothetical protein
MKNVKLILTGSVRKVGSGKRKGAVQKAGAKLATEAQRLGEGANKTNAETLKYFMKTKR